MSFTYAIFSHRYPPMAGGVESFSYNLAHSLVARGDTVHLVTSRLSDSPAFEQDGRLSVWRLPAHPYLNGRMPVPKHNADYRRMWDELLEQKVDRVLVNTRLFFHSVEGCKFAKQKDLPLVVLDHGSAYLTFGIALVDPLIKVYEHALINRIKRYSPIFAGISNASRRWLENFGIHTDIVITNAIDMDSFANSASNRDFRSELGVSSTDTLISFIGRITPEKGALNLAKAVQSLGPDVHVGMAGIGSESKAIESLGCSRNHLLGRLEREDVARLVQQSDLLCLPSRSEGCCTTLLESIACDTLPLITRVGGTDEVMGDSSDLLLAGDSTDEIAKGIHRCLEISPDRRRKLLDEMRGRVQRDLSWEAACRQLDSAYF